MKKPTFGRFALLPALLLSMGGWLGCAPVQTKGVERVIEPVKASAPALPETCTSEGDTTQDGDVKGVLVVFTSDWCTACEKQLAELTTHQALLEERGFRVVQAVVGVQGKCLGAARVARKAPFPYVALSATDEDRWAIRSTPTMWLLTPDGHTVLLYLEGRLSIAELLAAVDVRVEHE